MKLNHMKLRPFQIAKVKESVNYELELPPAMRIHSVFHIFVLEPADSETPVQINLPEIDPESQVIKFEIKEILDQQKVESQQQYLIK